MRNRLANRSAQNKQENCYPAQPLRDPRRNADRPDTPGSGRKRKRPAQSARPHPEPAPRPHRTACVSLPPHQPRLRWPPPRPSPPSAPAPPAPRLPPAQQPPTHGLGASPAAAGSFDPPSQYTAQQHPKPPATRRIHVTPPPPGLPGACLPRPLVASLRSATRGPPTDDSGRGGAGSDAPCDPRGGPDVAPPPPLRTAGRARRGSAVAPRAGRESGVSRCTETSCPTAVAGDRGES